MEPIKILAEKGVYMLEMTFGHLYTSINYNNFEKKLD
jgi:hypothetical protein